MRGGMDGGGCFRTGKHYPGIAHLLSISVEGLAEEFSVNAAVRDLRWVSIDTETTGRDADKDRVIEVGFVVFEAGEVVLEKGWLIDPECPIPPDATEVHGITDADVAGKPKFRELVPEMLEVLEGCLPLAYNAEFDRNFLRAEMLRAGESGAQVPAFRDGVVWADPLSFARELQKDERSRALGDVCARLGIPLENAHRATDDAAAAGKVLVAFLGDPRVPPTYGAFIKEQQRLEKLFELTRFRRS